MTLFTHEATADLEFNEPPTRLYRFLARLGGWTWEWSLGIGIDEEGEVDGSGLLLRLELPSWIAAPIRRWCYAHQPEWMKMRRHDAISDALLASLAVQPRFLGEVKVASPTAIKWVEDRLNPRSWRPE